MRVVLVVFLATLVLAGCKRETQEAVAQAKGAAADAERSAKEAADQVAATARSTKDQAKAAADDAAARAREAGEQARVAAAGATDSARQTLDSTNQRLREMTAGDQVQGTLVGLGSSELDVRPAAEPSRPVETVHTDAQTRWILRGAAAGRGGFPIGSTVRITYIVKNGQRIATQVETVTP